LLRSEYGYTDEYILSKPLDWLKASVDAILKRKASEMKWQMILVSLAQPVFDEGAAADKAELVSDIMSMLDGDKSEPDPLDDEDTIALLEMAGRKVVRNA